MRFYIIGAGFISQTHAEGIMSLRLGDDVQIKVADPNGKALQAFMHKFPEAHGYSSAEAMLSEAAAEDDVVIVGTPPFTHFILSKMALQSGRHVLCEKPLVMNEEEADLLIKEALAQRRYLGCCSTRFLQLPKMEQIKKKLQSDMLGDIYKITFINRTQRNRSGIEYQPESRWFIDRSRSGGGTLFDWGPYDIAQLNDMLKPDWVEVSAAWTKQVTTEADPADCINDVESHCGAMVKYGLPNGKIAWLHYERASCTHGEAYFHTEIEGTRGAVRWQSYKSDELTTSLDRDGKVESVIETFTPSTEPKTLHKPIRYFVDKIKAHTDFAIVNEQAVFNFKCLMAIYRSAELGKPVRVTLQKMGD